MLNLRRGRGEEGATAILVAIVVTGFMVLVGVVLDFALVRFDRQVNKASADSAAMAGLKGVDLGDGKVHPYAGVCEAYNYLRVSQSEMADLSGSWTDGLGNPVDGVLACTLGSALQSLVCNPADKTTWARFTGTAAGGRISVRIRSGYEVDEAPYTNREGMSSLASDPGEPLDGGCDQLAVLIDETQTPGFGSIAGGGDLESHVRAVGRLDIGEQGDGAVALLLLERNDCQALTTEGTNAGIRVRGFEEQPGMIHSDSLGNGSFCNSNDKVVNGNHTDGVVAEQAETGSPQLPGIIGVRALTGETGAVPTQASDPIPEVWTGPYPPGGNPTARGLITRSPVDNRYLNGVRNTVLGSADEWALVPGSLPSGWTQVGCNPTAAEQLAAGNVFVHCPNNPGFKAANVNFANATKLVFNGKIEATNLQMPRAREVYVNGVGAVGIKADTFRMHHDGQASCSSVTLSERATLVIRGGSLTSNGGLLQLCGTTVLMLGGYDNGCLPLAPGADPSDTPCPTPGGSTGNGIVKIAGTAAQDWTAPDLVSGFATQPDWDVLEDLALWSESYGVNADFTMAGSGSMYLSGIFMLPNADPFNIKGGGGQNVENSQYVARRLNVTGNGTLLMRPDPHDVVTIPIIGGFTLVR